jgi:hypothetical protein
MKRIGIRELNQQASSVIDRVRNGEVIEVTDQRLFDTAERMGLPVVSPGA